nr:papain-like protease [Diuris virus B]
KNKCCFESIMQSQNWSYDNLLDAMKGTVFIQKMIDDKGLLVDELVELIKKININVNVVDSAGKLIELNKGAEKVLLLSSNHCK